MAFDALESFSSAAAAAQTLKQGEILDLPDACVFLASRTLPLSMASLQAAADTADDEGGSLVVVAEPVDQVMLLTQTCDLQITNESSRSCQVAPVVRGLDQVFVKEVASGRRVGFAALPWLDSFSVADLSRITTIERGLLVGLTTLARPTNPKQEFDLASAIGRTFSRVALPDPVVEVLRPVLQRMRDRHKKNTSEARAIARVQSIRVESSPGFAAEDQTIRLIFILDETDLPTITDGQDLDDSRIDSLVGSGIEQASVAALDSAHDAAVPRREAWVALTELWAKPSLAAIPNSSSVGELTVEVLNGAEFSFARSLNAPELDLMYLSRPDVATDDA